MKTYTLPKLNYSYKDLEPFISEQQLMLHHSKHHAAYVNNANNLLTKLREARENSSDLDMKAILKELSFNIGGHVLHSIFWDSMCPNKEGKEQKPYDLIENAILKVFKNYDRFKSEFSKTALSVEGSGWAALCFCPITQELFVAQIEKHSVNLYPSFDILMVLDVWEHAYYLDYKNNRASFIDNFWKIVNWEEINKKYSELV
ncbi:MAG: superoxide dismutase [Candidatus Diapherotrites archaeon]|nr:superoxide dismutase [Candidatus Diapherotrites archaeon]